MFKKKNKEQNGIQVSPLITVNNRCDLGIIEDLLKKADIPYIIKERNLGGGYLMIETGSIMSDMDVYVEAGSLEKAKEAIDPFIN